MEKVENNNSFCIDEEGKKVNKSHLNFGDQIAEETRLDTVGADGVERSLVGPQPISQGNAARPACQRERPLENITQVFSKQTVTAVLPAFENHDPYLWVYWHLQIVHRLEIDGIMYLHSSRKCAHIFVV